MLMHRFTETCSAYDDNGKIILVGHFRVRYKGACPNLMDRNNFMNTDYYGMHIVNCIFY